MISFFKFKRQWGDIYNEWKDFVPSELEHRTTTQREDYSLLQRLMHGEFDKMLKEEGVFEEWETIRWRWE